MKTSKLIQTYTKKTLEAHTRFLMNEMTQDQFVEVLYVEQNKLIESIKIITLKIVTNATN